MSAAVHQMDEATVQAKAEKRKTESRIKALRQELAELERQQMPASPEVEQALLGAILRHNNAFDAVSEYLRPEHFYVPEHARLFEIIREKVDVGETVSPASLSHIAESDAVLSDAGGQELLYELATNVVTVLNAGEYGRTVFDLARKRELILLGEDIVASVFESSSDVDATSDTLLDEYGDRLTKLEEGASRDADATVSTLADALTGQIEQYEAAFQDPEAAAGVRTGLHELDHLLGGLQKGNLYLLGGRPGMGKTALALDIGKRTAKRDADKSVREGKSHNDGVILFFSQEMSNGQLSSRILASLADVNTFKAARGECTPDEIARMMAVRDEMRKIPLILDDKAGHTMASIRRRVRQTKRKHRVALVIIDYLQLVSPSADSRRKNSRNEEVSEMSRDAKLMAKAEDVPVLLLSQLSRQVENREDKRPQLSDLRDSGAIEQDADAVCFVYRQQYYLEKEVPEQRPNESEDKFQERQQRHETLLANCRNTLEVIVAKQRHGPTGTAELFCDLSTMTIDNIDRVHS